MFFGNTPATLLGTVFAILMAITCHEVAHGYVAYKLGDPTAKSQGRLTLNPIAHLDPIGALMMLVTGFGWAKPVPVNPFYFQGNRIRGMMLVSVAGPATNLVLSFLGYALYLVLQTTVGISGTALYEFFIQFIYLNLYLAVFNLIPIPPLDGSKILAGLLPRDKSYKFMYTMDRYGFAILLVLLFLNIPSILITPVVQAILHGYGAVLSLFFL